MTAVIVLTDPPMMLAGLRLHLMRYVHSPWNFTGGIIMKVGVIGAGTMGSGIAQAFAQTEGYEVCLCDINEEIAANG